MLNDVSWQEFIFAAVGVVSLYYLIMIGAFVKRMIRKDRNDDPAGSDNQRRRYWQAREEEARHPEEAHNGAAGSAIPESDDAPDENANEDFDEEKAFNDLSELARAIEGIMVSENEGLARKQFMEKVAIEIRRFPQLNQPPYKIAIANLVRRKAQSAFNLTITVEEVDALW